MKQPIEVLYEQHENLIKQQAWKMSKALNIHFDEALSEVHLAFCESAKSWEEGRGAFTTFLYRCVKSHTINLRIRQQTKKVANEELVDFQDHFAGSFTNNHTPEKEVIFGDIVKQNPVMACLMRFINTYEIPKNIGIKQWLTKELLNTGFHLSEIQNTWKIINTLR